jgi:3'-phosphoadenosine 5'-phosphosulfate sulfotransferase (PAPS reductase)/FAD synthetase
MNFPFDTKDTNIAHVISMSGGKDSTAMALYAREHDIPNTKFVFADTGHEHAQTYEYLDYLEGVIGPIEHVRADFTARIEHKRDVVNTKWRKDGVSEDKIARALEVLVPTGNPFLDLCLWKGRFPSTRRRFCSEELKHHPIDAKMDKFLVEYDQVYSWQGVRRDESRQRFHLVEEEDHPAKQGLTWYRPILEWTAEDCFAMHKKHNVDPNPLYSQGMGRVGCMPCIHATKKEFFEIARRFPEEIARIAEWEEIVSQAAKRDMSAFMDARVTANGGFEKQDYDDINLKDNGIQAYAEYAKTSHGGRQYDLIKTTEEIPMCTSIYGLCE